MKALRFHGRGNLRIDEIEIPPRKDNDVLVEVEWCGICGSDLHEYTQGPIAIPTPERPNVLTGDVLPVTLGHEFCGRVIQAPNGSVLKHGDPVMIDPRLFCRGCYPCKNGRTNSCRKFGFLGYTGGGGGGFSEYVSVAADQVYALPSETPLHLVALIEPLAVAWHGVSVAGVGDMTNQHILILGGGPIGLATAMVLKARGADKVIVSEPSRARRDQAAAVAEIVIDPGQQDLVEELMSLTASKGVNLIFDCAGIQKGIDDAMSSMHDGGTYVNIASWETTWNPPQAAIIFKELTLKGSMSYTDKDYREVVDAFIAGKFPNLQNLVTSRIALDDILEKGFKELLRNKEGQVKIMVTPKADLLITTSP